MRKTDIKNFENHYYYHPSILPHLIEIISVYRSIKPGCRINVSTKNLKFILEYLNSLNLNYTLKFEHKTIDNSFLTTSLTERELILKSEIIFLYVAKSNSDAKRLMYSETVNYDYSGFGKNLGYPDCCIKFAASNDKINYDKSGASKQTDLILLCVSNSDKCDYRCNKLISQSSLSDHLPLSIFSHYPCSLNCSSTINYSDEVLRGIKSSFPFYYDNLIEILNFPILYFANNELSINKITEFNGLALMGADFEKNRISNIKNIVSLDELIADEMSDLLDSETIEINKDYTLFESKTASKLVSTRQLKNPNYIDWKTNSVFRL